MPVVMSTDIAWTGRRYGCADHAAGDGTDHAACNRTTKSAGSDATDEGSCCPADRRASQRIAFTGCLPRAARKNQNSSCRNGKFAHWRIPPRLTPIKTIAIASKNSGRIGFAAAISVPNPSFFTC